MALGRVAFSLEELTKESGLSAIAAKFQLLRLRGKVVRVSPRQPFYLIVSPEHRSMGAPPPTWWLQDYFNWLGRPYYLALQSAASSFGSNPQALQVTQVMTDKPFRPIKVGRTQLRFFVKRGIERTPTQQPEGAVAPLLISTPEATAYDLIRYATSIGGIERAAETIRRFCRSCVPANSSACWMWKTNLPSRSGWGLSLKRADNKSLAKVVRDWLPDELTPVTLVSGQRQTRQPPAHQTLAGAQQFQ